MATERPVREVMIEWWAEPSVFVGCQSR